MSIYKVLTDIENLKRPSMNLDLQFFAGEDDEDDFIVEDGMGLEDEEEEPNNEDDSLEDREDEEEEEDSSEEDDMGDSEEEEEDSDSSPKDKKTKAIIKWKREAKEAQKKLAEMEEKLALEELKKKEEERVDTLIEQGYSEKEAKSVATKELENERLKRELADLKFQSLEARYTGISNYKTQILELKERYPDMTEAEIYLAKFSKASEFDKKTQLEQEILYKNQSAREKAFETGTHSKEKPTKLSREDERVYNYLKQYRPNLTKKEFLEIQAEEELE